MLWHGVTSFLLGVSFSVGWGLVDGNAKGFGGNTAGMQRAQEFLLVVRREFPEEGLGSGNSCCGWCAEEVVEADVSPGAAEEEAVGGDRDFREAAKAEQVM